MLSLLELVQELRAVHPLVYISIKSEMTKDVIIVIMVGLQYDSLTLIHASPHLNEVVYHQEYITNFLIFAEFNFDTSALGRTDQKISPIENFPLYGSYIVL